MTGRQAHTAAGIINFNAGAVSEIEDAAFEARVAVRDFLRTNLEFLLLAGLLDVEGDLERLYGPRFPAS